MPAPLESLACITVSARHGVRCATDERDAMKAFLPVVATSAAELARDYATTPSSVFSKIGTDHRIAMAEFESGMERLTK